MYHFDLVADFGVRHPVAARLVGVVDAVAGKQIGQTAVEILRRRSDAIRRQFNAQNSSLPDADECSTNELLVHLMKQQQEILSLLRAASVGSRDQGRTLDGLQQQVADLSSSLGGLSLAVHNASPPRASAVSIALGPNDSGEVDIGAPTPRTATKRAAVAAPTGEKQSKKPKTVKYAAGTECTRISISDLIEMMHKSDLLKGDKNRLVGVKLPHLKEEDKLRATLELVQFVMTEDQWATLTTPELSKADLASTAYQIQKSSMEKLRELLISVHAETQPAKGKERAKPFYIGVGSRVVKYKTVACVSSLNQQNEKKPKGLMSFFKSST
jgi:hypothetical protein